MFLPLFLKKRLSEMASTAAEIVFSSLVHREVECWGILARLAWTQVA